MIFGLIFAVILAAILWRKVYLSPITVSCYRSHASEPCLYSLKPKKFSSFFASHSVSSVKISDSYLAFFNPMDASLVYQIGSVYLPAEFLIVRVRKGRLCSVDLSDRELESVFKKITLVL